MVVVITIFMLLHVGPTDPAAMMAGDNATREQIEAIRKSLYLDRPLLEQLWLYLKSLAALDLGTSVYSKRPVVELVKLRLEPTFMLAVMTTLLSVLIAVPAGVLAAWRAGSLLDRWLMAGIRRRVLGAGIRHRLRAGPGLRHLARLVPGPGLQADGRGRLGVPAQPRAPLAGAGLPVRGAPRPHHPRDHDRGARGGLHPHSAGEGRAQPCACSASMR